MTHEKPSKLHPEEAKLAGALVSFFGVLMAVLGAIMVLSAEHPVLKEASGSLTLVWGGIVIFIAGQTIRRSGELIQSPKWFLSGFFWGVISTYGVLVGISQGDVKKAMLFALIQMFSAYAIWRSCLIKKTNQ